MESNRYEDQPVRQIEADKAWGWGILFGFFLGMTAFYNPKPSTSINPPSFQRVDQDSIADLVNADGNIFLADETENGLVYRRLQDSDKYRIR